MAASKTQWNGSRDLRDKLVPLATLDYYERNPREGDVGAICTSLEAHGQYRAIVYNKRKGARSYMQVLAGNHTMKAAYALGWTHIAATAVYVDDDDAARIVAVDNRTNDLASYDEHELADLLTALAASPSGLHGSGFDGDDLDDLLARLEADDLKQNADVAATKRNPRLRDVDIIYTANNRKPGTVLAHCCMAVRSSWLYGTQSGAYPCEAAYHWPAHKPVFVDNEFTAYDHARHLEAVAKWKPRYATVRDIMTKAQCEKVGAEYYPTGQILEWAAELAEHAENVIVIPKTRASIDQIPEQYMLGFSVPTSYGGTPVPVEAFKGRRVHLLGGSPNKQLQYWQQLTDEVVSLDNNYVLKQAQFGSAWCGDGKVRNISDLGIPVEWEVTNPMYIALMISLGSFGSWCGKDVGDAPVGDMHRMED